MHPVVRLFGIAVVFVFACMGWMILGGITKDRSSMQQYALTGSVTDLWGSAQTQAAPTLTFAWDTSRVVTQQVKVNGKEQTTTEIVWDHHEKPISPASTDIDVDLRLDMRRKGLVWYPLYDVDFAGAWTYTNNDAVDGEVLITFAFPNSDGIYDDFSLIVNGEDRASQLVPAGGRVSTTVPVRAGETMSLRTTYGSRGMTSWNYQPATGVTNLDDFSVAMSTDFADIDFPNQTMSPSSKEQTESGWNLRWDFAQVVTGSGVGMVMPERIQPGELAADLAFSAPVSLLFFFLVIFVLSVMRGIEIHPINYLFIAGAFFAFHLLFAYSVDHLAVEVAFALCSAVSVFLVVSYLRLVVSNRFAFVEAGAAQLIYLVGFSLAHFWDGYTGLTVTVLSITTLFLLMQLTGRIRWSEAMSRKSLEPEASPAAS